MPLLNSSGIIGQTLMYMTINITGSEFLTHFVILMALFVLGMALRMPMEMIPPILLPVVLVLMASATSWLVVGGILLIYLAILFISMFPIK